MPFTGSLAADAGAPAVSNSGWADRTHPTASLHPIFRCFQSRSTSICSISSARLPPLPSGSPQHGALTRIQGSTGMYVAEKICTLITPLIGGPTLKPAGATMRIPVPRRLPSVPRRPSQANGLAEGRHKWRRSGAHHARPPRPGVRPRRRNTRFPGPRPQSSPSVQQYAQP